MKRNKNTSGRGTTRKALAAFLSASMLLAQVPMAIYAEDAAEKGLCTHHTQHTEECGYREAKAGSSCNHVCSAESGCSTTEGCVHTHDASCGYGEAVEAKECKYVKESCPDCEAEAKAAAESEAARKAAEEAAKAEQEKQQKIQTVQAFIDALPEADGITQENLETVKGQLAAIEEAKGQLDESSQSALNLSKYTAAAEKTVTVEAEQEAARKAAEEAERAAAEEAAKAEQEKQQKIQTIQALIDALPEADGITPENLETVKGQLSAIEEAKAGLDENSQTALDLTSYTAAAEKVAAVEAEQEAARKAAESEAARKAEEEAAKAEQEKQQKIQAVQALIDALPEADGITAENLETVKGQLSAIEEAKAGLDESSQTALNLTRYTVATEKVATLETKTDGETESESENESESETEKPKPKRTQKRAAAATNVASVTIGDQTQSYSTLRDAFNAANNQTATITVLQDVNEELLYTSSIGGDITLIGGNHTIVMPYMEMVGSLTVESGNIDSLIMCGGTLNVKGGVVSYTGVSYSPGGTINVYAGTVKTINLHKGVDNPGIANIYGGYVERIQSKGLVNIYGGNVTYLPQMYNDFREYELKISIDFQNERMKGFETDKTYTITYKTAGGADKTLSVISTDGTYALAEEMLGTLFFISGGENAYQSLLIPERPTPDFSVDSTASTLTATSQASGIEYSFDGGAWDTAAQWTGLKAKSKHTIKARIPASDSGFKSEESQVQNAETSAASYTIKIPSEVTAGGNEVTIEPTALDLGAGGKVAVSVSSGLDDSGRVILTREGAQNQIFAPLSAGGTATPPVGSITGTNDSISLSVGTPVTADNSQIPAGEYSGTVTFTYQYSEQ